MNALTIAQLIDLNRRFYAENGPSFAATRRRIQDGVQRVLDMLPDVPGERWLDLGCGSGALAALWLRNGRRGAYHGLDFSETLLDEARHATAGLPKVGTPEVTFTHADLSDPHWAEDLQPGFAGVLSFAVLHHLPSRALRLQVMTQVNRLLVPGGRFCHSEWQFQNSPKLMARRLPWKKVGLSEEALEPGDTLLDWRAAQSEPAAVNAGLPPDEAAPAGAPKWTPAPAVNNLRYVHLFTRAELAGLASEAGFRSVDEFESDGHGGRLGLYQCWEKTGPV